MTNFTELVLHPIIKMNIAALGYTVATPIQEQAIPILLAGRDLLGIAQTGTGKTASFALPIINHLLKAEDHLIANHCHAIILVPTRELASQVNESIIAYSKGSNLTSTVIIGGVSKEPQIAAMSEGVDIVVATPGRFIDLFEDGYIKLSQVKYFVLDEADMMLDMGFYKPVKNISDQIPPQCQNILFSATMPQEIEVLAEAILNKPVKIEVAPQSSTVDKIEQSVYFTLAENKNFLLLSLLEDQSMERVLIFCKAKYGVVEIVDLLNRSQISVGEIHSNLTQGQRNQSIEDFKTGTIRVLVATDIAARGIDIDDVDLVINYNMPEDATYYVHRIGRSARAQRDGRAISLCSEKDIPLLRNVQKLIGKKISPVLEQPFHHDYNISKPSLKKNHKGIGRRKRRR